MARSQTPCEFRVLHSQPLDDDVRIRLANLDTTAAEKCLNQAEDAVVQLDQPLTTVIYLVATMSDDEKEADAAAEVKWLERRKAVLAMAAAAAANPRQVDMDGDPQEEDGPAPDQTQQGGGDGVALHGEFPDEQDPDGLVPDQQVADDEAELMAQALQQQIEDELAATAGHGTKREEPVAVAPSAKSSRSNSKKTHASSGRAKKAHHAEEGDFE